MTQHARRSRPLRVLVLSTYVPRECGIATYAEDVIHAVEPHGAVCRVVAMERPGQPYAYGERVIDTIREDDPDDYLRAAERINRGEFDVLSVQHEFGIYGGGEAEHLTRMLAAVRLPVVVTFHTILRAPSPGMRRNQRAIGRRADTVVVMNGLAPAILDAVYEIPLEHVHVVHHGAPVPHRARGVEVKRALGLEGQDVIATFGLLGPVKGLEYMVRAMPRVVAARPQAVYHILGQTHPVVRQLEGERYREWLSTLAEELGVTAHVRFDNRYLSKEELVTYLLATDTYVNPYTNLEQVTSGTLAYAMGSGCPIVATPFLHACYLLQDGRGVIVPDRDPDALARGCLRILADPAEKARMEQVNWAYGHTLRWPQIGAAYLRIFRTAVERRRGLGG